MIQIIEATINDLPLLEIVENDKKDERLPTVIFYHGWTNYKESVLVNGYELAKRGFRALLPDAHLHGKRMGTRPVTENNLEFWNVVSHSIQEAPIIRDHYIKKGLSDPERFGVSGLSMGGITTSAMLTQYDWIKSAVILMGSPAPIPFSKWLLNSSWASERKAEWKEVLPKEKFDAALEQLIPISLDLRPEKISGRPVLFWHGTEDNLVPFAPTYEFYQQIKQESYAESVSFSVSEGVGHKVPYTVSVEMADFFKENL